MDCLDKERGGDDRWSVPSQHLSRRTRRCSRGHDDGKASLQREERRRVVRLNLLVVEADTVELDPRTVSVDDEDIVITTVALFWLFIGVVELPWTIRKDRNHYWLSDERHELECDIQ